MRLVGKVAVVLGAAGGLGRAVCTLLAREGAHLGLLDASGKELDTLAATLQADGARCALAEANARDRLAMRSAIDGLARELGPIDILVACAGIGGTTGVDDLDIDRTEAMVRVKLMGMAYALDAVLPGMLARRSGQIVGISSPAGVRGIPGLAGCGASQAALSMYLESLRPALRRRGIAVSTVYLPIRPAPEPQESARLILESILKRRRVHALGWRTHLAVAWLRWLPPGWYDWYMTRNSSPRLQAERSRA